MPPAHWAAMLLLLDPPGPSAAHPAGPPQRDRAAADCELGALLRQWALDLAELDIRVHLVRDDVDFAAGTVVATVANRRLRVSRTYVYHRDDPHWSRELEQDLLAGVFAGAPTGAGTETETVPAARRAKRKRARQQPALPGALRDRRETG